MSVDIAIDVGSSRTKIFIPKEGIVLDEPSVVTIDTRNNEIIAIGEEAHRMLGKTSDRFSVEYPLKGGVVCNFELMQEMMRLFFKKIKQSHVTLPRVIACVPSDITEVETQAIVDSISGAGVRSVFLIEAPVAAAIGSGIEIGKPGGTLIMDVGAGTTDIAITTLSGIANSKSIKFAGNTFDDETIKFFKKVHGLLIGTPTAEKIKTEIGEISLPSEDKHMLAKGRDNSTGMPKAVDVKSSDLKDTYESITQKMIDIIKELLEDADPELAGDIFSNGIHLSGGGAKLSGFKEFLQKQTNLPVFCSEKPENTIINGASISLDFLKKNIKNQGNCVSPLIARF